MRRQVDPIFVLFFVSGFGGLIYESVWSHYVKLFLGHAAYAQTLVLVVFIGGLALGSWLCARVAERLKNPLRLYAFIELAIGLVALAFDSIFRVAIDWGYASLLPAACEPASTFCAAQWGLAAVLLFPQSVLLGATFPLVSSAVLRLENTQPGHDISALYFLNSLGAVLGVLASAFVLIPAVGLPGTLMTAGLANIAIALVAYALSRVPPPPLAVEPAPAASEAEGGARQSLVRVLLATAFLTGLSSFIYEIAWIRMLSLVLGSSTHSFELMLASFILGLAIGGLWVRNRIDSTEDPVRFLALVQLVMGTAAAATIPIYNGAFDLMAWLLSSLARSDGGFVLFNVSSSAIALLVMLPATVCAGMTLPLITYRLLRSSFGEKSLGQVYAVNTLGSILGVAIAVHLLMEALGVRGALLVGAAIDVALGVSLLAWMSKDRLRGAFRPAAVTAIVALLVITVAFPLDPRKTSSGVFRSGAAMIPPTHSIAFHRDGKTATVDVIESQGGNTRAIRTNGKSDAALAIKEGIGPTGDEFTMTLLGLLPLGHRPEAKTAAVIGFGSGLSTTVLLGSPNLERVDTVEIEPAMVEGARLFIPIVDAAYHDPRSRIVIDDAKSFFARGRNRYDIIVSEPSNPWVSGVAALFTEEFYQRLSTYLNEGGVLSQWLHTYEMDPETLASILTALSKTFPDFVIYSSIDTDLIVVARKGGDPGRFRKEVLDWPKIQPLVAKLKFQDAEIIHRRSVGHWSTLKPLFRSYGMPANSDYYPIVDQRASKTRFTQAKVTELVELQASVIPMLGMLDGRAPPAPSRAPITPTTYVDAASTESWALHDLVLGTGAPPPLADVNAREAAARLLHLWALSCPKDVDFDAVRLAMVSVAEVVNPNLGPEASTRMWKSLSDSPCAKKLGAQDRRWIELLDAVARRDAARMAATGVAVLESMPASRTSATEYAFFTAMTGLVCTGDRAARAYLEDGVWKWVRSGTRRAEIRLLDVLTRPQSPGEPRPTCRTRGGA